MIILLHILYQLRLGNCVSVLVDNITWTYSQYELFSKSIHPNET
jgi:hypothetical protein